MRGFLLGGFLLGGFLLYTFFLKPDALLYAMTVSAQADPNNPIADPEASDDGPRPAPKDRGSAPERSPSSPTAQQPEAEKILCPHCRRTANNGIKCQGICVADSDY